MATNFVEIFPVRLPEGTREELSKIAASRYESASAVARKAIMAEIEKAKRERGKRVA
jgi:hypothetical protein